MAFAYLSMLARSLAQRTHPLQTVTFGFALGAAMLASGCLKRRRKPSKPAARGLLPLGPLLLYLDAGPTALADICYFCGMRLSRTATSGMAATMVEPTVAAVLVAAVIGEHLSAMA
jgi:hypothetical protein